MSQKKRKLEFKTFNDGIVQFMLIDEDDNLEQSMSFEHCFSETTVGVKRYYAARSNDIEIEKVIEIHQDKEVSNRYAAVIDRTRYKIEQVQHIKDTLPKTTVIALSQRGLYEGECYDV